MPARTQQLTQLSFAHSVTVARNVLTLGMAMIARRRGLLSSASFREACFGSGRYETFDDTDTHARIFLRWLREGVSNALVKRYLKDVTLVVMHEDRVSVIETFVFAVDYTTAGEVNLTTTGTGRLPVTRSFVEEGLQCLIGSLEEHLGTLPPLPLQVSFALQLSYYPERTPAAYHPPEFAAATDAAMQRYWRQQDAAGQHVNGDLDMGHVAVRLSTSRFRCDGASARGDLPEGDDVSRDAADDGHGGVEDPALTRQELDMRAALLISWAFTLPNALLRGGDAARCPFLCPGALPRHLPTTAATRARVLRRLVADGFLCKHESARGAYHVVLSPANASRVLRHMANRHLSDVLNCSGAACTLRDDITASATRIVEQSFETLGDETSKDLGPIEEPPVKRQRRRVLIALTPTTA
jgi:hypothetical protein